MQHKINQIRREIAHAFSGLKPPGPANLIGSFKGYLSRYYDRAKTEAAASEFREELSGKLCSELDQEFLFTKNRLAAFCYLSAEAYRYYLPALLTVGIDTFTPNRAPLGDDSLFTILFQLRPEWRDCYYDNNQHFNEQTSLFSLTQYRAVCSFLGLIFDTADFERFQAAQALRWGWNKYEHIALTKSADYFHNLHHYQYPSTADPQIAALVEQIKAAFAEVPYPGDDQICGRPDHESAEYALEFRGLNWRTLHPTFLSKQSGALSFFTPPAERYFLPAYLMADLMKWHGDTPVLNLILSFQHEPAEGTELETLLAKFRSEGLSEDEAYKIDKYMGTARFAIFNQDERKAIVAYLRYKSSTEEYDKEEIEMALQQYWLNKP